MLKEECHTNYKKYRNLLSTLMKKSKQAYYDRYFERNWNNIKNMWKWIKSLVSLKTLASSIPTVLSLDNGDTITNPYDIANTFNNYFASIALKLQKKAKESDSTIFLQSVDKEEIVNIISSLNSSKGSGPNSIPYRILFLLNKQFQSNWQIYSTSLS